MIITRPAAQRPGHFKESVMNRMFAVLGGGLLAAGLSIGAYAQEAEHKGHDHSKKSAEAKEVTVQGELIDTAWPFST